MKQINHKKIFWLSIVFIILGVISSLVIRKSIISDFLSFEKSKLVLSEKEKLEISQIPKITNTLPLDTFSNTIRENFYRINLTNPDYDTFKALEWLKSGLLSDETSIRLTSAALIRALLIDVGYQNVVVHREIKDLLDSLFLQLNDYGKEALAEMQEANPNSLALQYLKSIKL